jgi:hypothetical protein
MGDGKCGRARSPRTSMRTPRQTTFRAWSARVWFRESSLFLFLPLSLSVQPWREREMLEGIAGEGDGSRQGCGAYRHKTQAEPLPKPWTLNLEGRNLVRRFCWRFGIVRKENSIPVQLEQKPSHLSLLFTQLSLSHQGLLVCSGLLGRRVVWVPMRSCACLHTWWKDRVWMGVWAFFDRSRNISREQNRIPGELWQWRQCLCIHVSNVQLLDPVNWWEGFPLFCYRGATRIRNCESEFSFFGRSSRFSEQVKKQHQLLLSAWFAIDGQWMCRVYRAPVRVTYRYLEDNGTKVHMSTRGNASGSIVIPYRVILREMKTTSSSGRFSCKLSL